MTLSADAVSAPTNLAKKSGSLLKNIATSWFAVAFAGQLMFVVYVIAFYGGHAVTGNFAGWNKVLPRGYIPGDTMGNLLISLHLLFAVFITVGGMLQLLPKLRQWAPRFHRWNGRVYIVSAFMMGLGGMAISFTRGSSGEMARHVAINLNAILIMVCAVMAYRHARARHFDVHRRWALRLFLVVSGVWFFRIGLMFWIVVNQGPVGFDPKTFSGPALTTIAYAQYLVPLLMLELYFHAQKSNSAITRFLVASSLALCTLATAAGIAAASMILWLPKIA